jgi:GNAT superfamily N-acetyltransferase
MEFALRPATADDFQFAFAVKRDALGPYVAQRWGWDDDVQLLHHQGQWTEKPWQVILRAGERVGTVSVHWRPTHLQFGEFYIAAPHRRQGLGTAVLRASLEEADGRRLETRLEYLKWNPVASLYARHGFRIVSENDIHYFLVRSPREA